MHGGTIQKGVLGKSCSKGGSMHIFTPTCFDSVGARVSVSVRNTVVKPFALYSDDAGNCSCDQAFESYNRMRLPYLFFSSRHGLAFR
jgi:hypothetical protein